MFPASLDMSPCAPASGEGEGGYLWPFCSQPLYYGGAPLMINLTVLNGMSLYSNVSLPPSWTPSSPSGLPALDVAHVSNRSFDRLMPPLRSAGESILRFRLEWPSCNTPWGGSLGVVIEVSDQGEHYEGLVTGEIVFEVENLSGPFVGMTSTVRVPLTGECRHPDGNSTLAPHSMLWVSSCCASEPKSPQHPHSGRHPYTFSPSSPAY